jgi:hypothetical protein
VQPKVVTNTPLSPSGLRVSFGAGDPFDAPGHWIVWIDDVVCDLR